ncbi:MAG: hypothetical protein WC867_00880 [Candidatus Pacearchaeota archaeon]|jgi:hypothetical protein
MKNESFIKIENESFYTSPPYNYRPSIAEYLTTFKVTSNSFIASVMYLDNHKNLKILKFEKDFFLIKLIDNKNLKQDEIIIWDYLSSLENNNEIKFYFRNIPKKVLNNFHYVSMYITYNELGTEYIKKFNRLPDENIKPLGLNISRIILGVFFSMFNFLGILSFLLLFFGLRKMSEEKKEINFFLKKFIWRYVRINLVYLFFIFLPIIFISAILNDLDSSTLSYYSNFIGNYIFLIPFIFLAIVLLYLFIFYQFCIILYDYICWLYESKEAAEHRRNWLEFKLFVIKQSEIEKSPLSYYKLWGPFYYYTLAVGGIEKY